MKELRILKQEEATLVTMASKIGDQLNRLKVEELALQNLARVQTEAHEAELRASSNASFTKSLESGSQERPLSQDLVEDRVEPLDLVVNTRAHHYQKMEEDEEEEEDDDEATMGFGRSTERVHGDLEDFVDELT